MRNLRLGAALALLLLVAVACGGGSNLPSGSRSLTLPTLPSRSTAPTEEPTEPTEEPTEPTEPTTAEPTEPTAPPTSRTTVPTQPPPMTITGSIVVSASTSVSASATESSGSPWAWVALVLAVIAVVAAFLLRSASQKKADAVRSDAHRRALQASTDAMALRDRAAVLPMSAGADRARLLGDLSADVDQVTGEFEALRTEPAMQDASAEIGDVLLSLTDLRGAIAAQAGAGAIDEELLRQRSAVLEDGVQRLRQRLAQEDPAPPQGRT